MKKCKITFRQFLWKGLVEIVESIKNINITIDRPRLVFSIGMGGFITTVFAFLVLEATCYWYVFIIVGILFLLTSLYGTYLDNYCNNGERVTIE